VIDVIIPTYNQPDMLKQCLRALASSTKVDYNLVIADDNSNDPDMRPVLKGLNVILNASGTRGFPNNCNYAVSKTKSEFICLLNSDTIPTPLWLDVMLEEMDDPSIGVVGARLLYPGGHRLAFCIQHAGVAHNREGMPYHIYRGMDRHFPPANERRELNAVTFAVALIRRSLWEELGGLSEAYRGGQFEDMDFCARARQKSWRVVYQPLALLYHHEHGSGEQFVAETSTTNARLYHEMWGRRGSDEYLFKPTGYEHYRDRLASVMHELRGQSMRFVYGTKGEAHVEHCQRLSRLPFKNLPEADKTVALGMADVVLQALTEFDK
jgi:GT2 family glycosyltransferase